VLQGNDSLWWTAVPTKIRQFQGLHPYVQGDNKSCLHASDPIMPSYRRSSRDGSAACSSPSPWQHQMIAQVNIKPITKRKKASHGKTWSNLVQSQIFSKFHMFHALGSSFLLKD